MAENLCKKQNLGGVRLQECIFDVAVTNDTALSQQGAYQPGKISKAVLGVFAIIKDECRLPDAMLRKGTLRK